MSSSQIAIPAPVNLLPLPAICRNHTREITVSTVVPSPRSSFGMKCVQCGHELTAPESSEFRNERQVHHAWHCCKCETHFESWYFYPPDTKAMPSLRGASV